MSDNNIHCNGSGIGLFTVVAIVLAVLKLTGLISISWGTIVVIWLVPSIILVSVLAVVILFLMFFRKD